MLYNYYYVQNFITRAMKVLNGKVNHKIFCFYFEFSTADSNICAYESMGRIMFYPTKILKDYGNYRMEIFHSYLLHIVIHELSHIDQLILYPRYKVDMEYQHKIENAANLNAFRFISENINALHAAFGNFDEFVFQQTASSINPNISRYYVGTDTELIKVAVEEFLIGDNKYKYESFDNIVMDIAHNMLAYPYNRMTTGRLQLKAGNKVINIQQLYPIIYQIRRHKTINVTNRKQGKDLFIELMTESDQPILNNVVRRD